MHLLSEEQGKRGWAWSWAWGPDVLTLVGIAEGRTDLEDSRVHEGTKAAVPEVAKGNQRGGNGEVGL